MVRWSLQTYLVAFLLLLHSALPAWAADYYSEPVHLDAYTSVGQRIFQLTQSRTLLSAAEQQELTDLIAILPHSEESVEHLESLSLSLGEKVLADVSALDTILFNIRKLSERHFGAQLPAPERRELRMAVEAWEQIDGHRRACGGRLKGQQPRDRSASVYQLLQCHADILVGTAPGTVGHVWGRIQDVLAPVYFEWNAFREKLAARVRTEEEDGHVVAGILDFDEMTFMDVFGELQAMARRISDPASPEF